MSAFKYLGLNNFHASIRWFLHIWILLYLRSGQLLGQLEIWVSFRAFAHEWPKACLKSGSVQHRKCAPPQLQGSKENQFPNMNKMMISHSLSALWSECKGGRPSIKCEHSDKVIAILWEESSGLLPFSGCTITARKTKHQIWITIWLPSLKMHLKCKEVIPQRGIKYSLLILTITITIIKSSITSLLYTIYNYMLYTVHYYYYKEEEFLPGLLPFPLCIIARKQLFTRKDINQIGT